MRNGFPKPLWVWRSTWAGAPVREQYIRESQHKLLADMGYNGPGWYPERKVLVMRIGEDAYEVSAWDCDPLAVWTTLFIDVTRRLINEEG